MYKIVFSKDAVKDMEKLKAAGLSKKAKDLIALIKEDPFKTPPRVEALVGNLKGAYSRRINIRHRLVYQIIYEPITEDTAAYVGTIKILRMWTHYE